MTRETEQIGFTNGTPKADSVEATTAEPKKLSDLKLEAVSKLRRELGLANTQTFLGERMIPALVNLSLDGKFDEARNLLQKKVDIDAKVVRGYSEGVEVPTDDGKGTEIIELKAPAVLAVVTQDQADIVLMGLELFLDENKNEIEKAKEFEKSQAELARSNRTIKQTPKHKEKPVKRTRVENVHEPDEDNYDEEEIITSEEPLVEEVIEEIVEPTETETKKSFIAPESIWPFWSLDQHIDFLMKESGYDKETVDDLIGEPEILVSAGQDAFANYVLEHSGFTKEEIYHLGFDRKNMLLVAEQEALKQKKALASILPLPEIEVVQKEEEKLDAIEKQDDILKEKVERLKVLFQNDTNKQNEESIQKLIEINPDIGEVQDSDELLKKIGETEAALKKKLEEGEREELALQNTINDLFKNLNL